MKMTDKNIKGPSICEGSFSDPVQLLSPAGSYESFLAAVNAGANAVYLAGNKYGARAYASNFSDEEILKAIRYAHIFGVEVYLTVNTLAKEGEPEEIIEFAAPLAEAGLDAFIVQDPGLALLLKKHFPWVALHASTQMAVTGALGAGLLESFGFKRVIPARECSLEDIANIRKHTELEIEVFVHGAMCYSYSGQCLFSSALGERSANRGRCAGPCRKDYRFGNERDSMYYLSLADLCGLEYLPSLIRAGATSFKVEGRMKPPEYVFLVTSIYRKYLDRFMSDPGTGPVIDSEDMDILRHFYHRGCEDPGYLIKRRGHHSSTVDNPAYRAVDPDFQKEILTMAGGGKRQIPVKMTVILREGDPLTLRLRAGKQDISVLGEVVQRAKNAPMDRKSVIKQISKLNDSPFFAESIDVDIDGRVFCTVKGLNELRRNGICALEERFITDHK